MSSPAEIFPLLARRADLLDALRGTERTKSELADALSVSRSTVDRTVRDLESHDLVERGDAVSLTLSGALALDAFDRFADQLGTLDEISSLLDSLPTDANVDPVLLRNAAVVNPSRVAPQRAVETYRELVGDATRVRGFVSAVLDTNVSTFREQIVERDVPVELVLAPDALDVLVASHDDAIVEARASGNFSLYRATTTLEYSLMLVEHGSVTYVCGLFYDDSGRVGLVRNDDPDVVAWAEDVYEAIRSDAEALLPG